MKQPSIREAKLWKAWEASLILSSLSLVRLDQHSTTIWRMPVLALEVLLLLSVGQEPYFPRLQVEQFEFSNSKKTAERLHFSLQVRSVSGASPADAASTAKTQGS